MENDLASEPLGYSVDDAAQILARTPPVLQSLLGGAPETWTHANEGEGTWSPFDVVGHLIHGERTDWIPRAKILLEHGTAVTFEPFDRFAQDELNAGRSLGQLLAEFASARADSLRELGDMQLSEEDLDRCGRHPEFGDVTLRQHLATWVVHDLGHIAQIVRAMAGRYRDEVGPWQAYLRILG